MIMRFMSRETVRSRRHALKQYSVFIIVAVLTAVDVVIIRVVIVRGVDGGGHGTDQFFQTVHQYANKIE